MSGSMGMDGEGDLLKRSLEEKKIDTTGLLVQKEGWATHVFTKLYDGDRELERIDYGNFNELQDATMEALTGVLEQALLRRRPRGIALTEAGRRELSLAYARLERV